LTNLNQIINVDFIYFHSRWSYDMELAHNKFPVDTTVTTATINDKPTDISISKFRYN